MIRCLVKLLWMLFGCCTALSVQLSRLHSAAANESHVRHACRYTRAAVTLTKPSNQSTSPTRSVSAPKRRKAASSALLQAMLSLPYHLSLSLSVSMAMLYRASDLMFRVRASLAATGQVDACVTADCEPHSNFTFVGLSTGSYLTEVALHRLRCQQASWCIHSAA